jgi:ribosomal protein L37AE/L43A
MPAPCAICARTTPYPNMRLIDGAWVCKQCNPPTRGWRLADRAARLAQALAAKLKP